MNTFVLSACLACCCYNLYVTWRVLRGADYTRPQKGLQVLLVWLVPLFGALLVHAMLRSLASPASRVDKHFIPEKNEAPG